MSTEPAPARALGLGDTVGIVVGIVVGTAIFVSPPLVFRNVHGAAEGLAVWLFGALLSLAGALCYAELATTYPRSGGDYEYLRRAFGPRVAFLFGWAQLTVVLTGSIGAMAYAFADYAAVLLGAAPSHKPALAAGAVVALTGANLVGVTWGKATQNVLSAAKVLGLALLVGAGLAAGPAAPVAAAGAADGSMSPSLGLALVFVLYAYGGWNDAAFVAAEVRDPTRNIPRALFVSIALIAGLYLLVNATYLRVLGLDGLRATSTPASDVLARFAGPGAGRVLGALVMVSALGAVNGLVLTGARVFASLGADHAALALLARRGGGGEGTPAGALVAQALVTLLLVGAVGTDAGHRAVDVAVSLVGLGTLPWSSYSGGFETLVAASAPVFWTFFLMTGISLFVLRARDGARERPFVVPLYPLPPLLFCASCAFMLHASVDYAGSMTLLAVAPVLGGLALYRGGADTAG